MKIASYRAYGLLGGRVVVHRQVHGDHQWRIKLRTKSEAGEVNVHEVRPAQRCPLSALADLVGRSIAEVCPAGERLLDAQMEFYIDDSRPARMERAA